jgi:hypothetical protein
VKHLASANGKMMKAIAKCCDRRHLPTTVVSQVRLPVRHGGLGLVLFDEALCAAAYLTSVGIAQVRLEQAHTWAQPLSPPSPDLEQLWSELQAVDDQLPKGSLADNTDALPGLQHGVMERMADAQFQSLVDACAPRNGEDVSPRYGRLQAVAGQEAGGWLSALPVLPGLRMTDIEVMLALRLRLGLPSLFGETRQCTCGRQLDPGAEHALTCRSAARALISRHDHCLRAWRNIVQAAGGSARVEPLLAGYLESIGKPCPAGMDRCTRGDILAEHLEVVKMLDVTIVHPNAPSHRRRAKDAGAVAEFAEKQKNSKYKAFMEATGEMFEPLAMESYGRWGKQAIRFLELCASWASASGRDKSEFLKGSRIALSVALQRGNAWMIARSLGSVAKQVSLLGGACTAPYPL